MHWVCGTGCDLAVEVIGVAGSSVARANNSAARGGLKLGAGPVKKVCGMCVFLGTCGKCKFLLRVQVYSFLVSYLLNFC